MANLKTKSIKELESWDQKELRKLKITTNNRISSLQASPKPKALPENHPLFQMDIDQCKSILDKIFAAEKKLRRN